MTDEDTRAAEYRAQIARRARAVAAQIAALRGSPSARRTLEVAWAPVVNRTKDTL